MPYKTGTWGIQAKERHKRRLEYFRIRSMSNRIHGGISLGYKGEMEARSIFKEDKLPNKSGADFKVKGKLIDVKTAIPTKTKYGWRWKFLLYSQKGIVDYFLIICKDKDRKTKYMFLIPDKEIKVNNLSITEKTAKRYRKYTIGSEVK